MRKSIEQLASELERDTEIGNSTLKEIAEKYGEEIPRIMDALDVIKIVHGQATQIPAVEW